MLTGRKLILVLGWLILAACHSPARPGAETASISIRWVTPTPTMTASATATPLPLPTAAPALPIIAPPTVSPSPEATPTRTPSPEPTATPTPPNWLERVGRTDEDLMYLGNPAASVTMIDYSDFL